jgi:D-glycero-D-manno-heptose 1,7-bisphosphate phosphatase
VKAVFLDRDGVINADREDYVTSWSQFHFLPGALEGLRHLTAAGYRLAVITNQSAIGRGIASAADVEEMNARMVSSLAEAGARIDAVLCCPHAPEEGCACRKPSPGLLIEAARRLRVSPADTCVVGDWVDDIAAARAAGCAVPILVLTGRGRRALPLTRAAGLGPFLVARNLLAAAEAIVSWGGNGVATAKASGREVEALSPPPCQPACPPGGPDRHVERAGRYAQ